MLAQEATEEAPEVGEEEFEFFEEELPWDYSPYKVLIWVASQNTRYSAESLREPLLEHLDRDFYSIWQTEIHPAPTPVATAAFRSMQAMTYDRIASSDPVIAIKRDHKDAVRIQSVASLPTYVPSVLATEGLVNQVKTRASNGGNETIGGADRLFEVVENDPARLVERWADKTTEGILVSRGRAALLDKPKAKILTLPIDDLISKAVDEYDKIFIVRISDKNGITDVSAIEMETLMRSFGPVSSSPFINSVDLPAVVTHCVTEAFSPMVRIDDAGTKSATGMIRASRLITSSESPADISVGDVLQPMIRKNDRNGKPIAIGPIEWAYLLATERDGPNVKMDFYSGMAGGLSGRANKRTFKMARLLKPQMPDTTLRLHAKGDPNLPLIGYELYQRELQGKEMTFVGRTDWDGRLVIPRTDDPLRLLYVKNGGAVLARLPLVPGSTKIEIADLTGDDIRLQAEAYIRGVQNAIIDLVAIRKLFAARIRLRLKRGELEEAEKMLNDLRDRPTNEELANDMGRKQGQYLKEIGTRNANQRRKVDLMFKETREMLGKQINPTIIRELESDLETARANGGKLPETETDS
ncbi:hypothetical protein LOC67_02145 [Stieleria sp. JC731]|uniref:hypothetical protein n=1 Tax=Pirellulaceae TaxID=2691357 RepID=UPI001E2A4C1E|nr:hypothetical protein [Stieleria sp. JC731]MCC9599345.1 hypothetical protein [Stieleria sp. JC731]